MSVVCVYCGQDSEDGWWPEASSVPQLLARTGHETGWSWKAWNVSRLIFKWRQLSYIINHLIILFSYLHPPLPEARTWSTNWFFSDKRLSLPLPSYNRAINLHLIAQFHQFTKMSDGPEIFAASYTAIEGRKKEVCVDEWRSCTCNRRECTELWRKMSSWVFAVYTTSRKSRTIFDVAQFPYPRHTN